MPNVNSYITGQGHNVLQVDATRTYYYGGSNGAQFRTSNNASELLNILDGGEVEIPNSGQFKAASSNATKYVRMYAGGGTGKWDIYGNGANLRITDNQSAGVLAVDTGAQIVGDVKIGTAGTPETKLQVQIGSIENGTILMGANYNGSGMSQNSEKSGAVHHPMYTSSTYPKGYRMLAGYADATRNFVQIGGGTNSAKSATNITFFTAPSVTANSAQRMSIDVTGNVNIGGDLPSYSGSSMVFINKAVNAAPATSGTTQTGGALRLRGGDNAVLDMGLDSIRTWIQATDRANLVNGYTLSLNPNGGNVGIGIAAPECKLNVVGSSATNWADSDAMYNKNHGAFIKTYNSSETAGVESGIVMRAKATGAGVWSIYSKQTSNYLADLHFRTRTSGSTSAVLLTIKNNGNIKHTDDTTIVSAGSVLRTGRLPVGQGISATSKTPTQLGFANVYINNWGGGRYVHMKTNIPASAGNGYYGMFLVKAHGYTYSSAKTINSSWGLHNWNGGAHSLSLQNHGNLAFAVNAYVSSDNYIVLVGDNTNSGSGQYTGWSMDFIFTNTSYVQHVINQSGPSHAVTSHSLSASTTGAF